MSNALLEMSLDTKNEIFQLVSLNTLLYSPLTHYIAPIVPMKHRGHAYHFGKVNEPVLIPCTSEGTVDIFEWYELSETTLRYVPIDLDKYELLDNGNTLKVTSAETRGFDFLCVAKNEVETLEGTFVAWIDNFPLLMI